MELDPATVRAAQAGSHPAMAAVLRRYVGPLHALVRRAAPGWDADELTQALLARLVEVLPRFQLEGPATLTTWVFTVAHRFLLDQTRRRHLVLAGPGEGAEVADGAPSPEDALARREELALVEAELAALPEAQRRAFVLAVVHGQPLAAIAEVEGVPVGTIKSRLSRARVTLLQRLGGRLADGKGGQRAV